MSYPRIVYTTYDDYLDEVLEPVKIGTLEYSPSAVFKAVDPIAYRCDLNDYLSMMHDDGYFCFECEYFECECE